MSLHTVRLFVYMWPEIISPKVMTALWWQPLKLDLICRCDMLLLSLSPGQQLLQGYFLPCLAWRQPRGPGELRGWQGHLCHLPLNLPRPANAKPGTQHWWRCHGTLHWQNGMAEMFEVCAWLLFSYGSNKQKRPLSFFRIFFHVPKVSRCVLGVLDSSNLRQTGTIWQLLHRGSLLL